MQFNQNRLTQTKLIEIFKKKKLKGKDIDSRRKLIMLNNRCKY